MTNPLGRFLSRPWLLGGPATFVSPLSAVPAGAWVAGSAGSGVGVRFVAPLATTLVDVYFYVAVGPTAATVGSVVELHAATGAGTMSATVIATAGSQTFALAGSGGSGKWYRFTFPTPPSLTGGSTYFVSIGINAASGDGVQVRRRGTGQPHDQGVFLASYQLGTGGASNSTGSDACNCVLAFGDGSIFGHPYVDTANDTSSALERGFKVEALDVGCTVAGASFAAGATNANALKIYDGATAPGGSPLLSVAIDSTAAACGVVTFAPFTLQANKAYRVVLGFSGASTGPGTLTITAESTFGAVLESAGYAAQGLEYTVDNGAGGWADSTDKMPRLNLLISGVFDSSPSAAVIAAAVWDDANVAEVNRRIGNPSRDVSATYAPLCPR